MYGTIRGSLNISLSKNPVFLEGHRSYVRLASAVIRVSLTLLFFARFFLSRLVYIARYVLSSLNVSSRGTKFEIFREDVSYLHFT